MPRLNKTTLRRLFFIAVLLALIPFAVELIFVAEIMGAEVTVLFFVYWLKDQWQQLDARLQQLREWLRSLVVIVSMHAIGNSRVFLVHATASVMLFALTGSLFYFSAVWYPVVMFGGAPAG